MNVAPLKSSDAMRYRTLMLEAYESASDALTSTADERAGEAEMFWVKRIADPTGISVAFGAFEGQELIGTVALEFSTKPKTKHKALVIGMFVKPQARGRGAGGALLQAAVQHARSRDEILLLTLTATEGNEPAINLYRTAGFEVFCTEPLAILTPSGYKAKVYMWLPLTDARTAA